MSEEQRNKLKAEIFGKLPESKSIAALIDQSNYPKLLELMADVEREHGKIACQILLKELEIAHPEAYRKWRIDVKEAKQKITLALAKGHLSYKESPFQGLLQIDWNILCELAINKTQLERIAKTVIEELDYISVAEFLDHYEQFIERPDPESIKELPEAWPNALKIAATFPPLYEFAEQLYCNLPTKQQTSASRKVLVNNLAKALVVAAGNLQRNRLKLESH